jgi:predicted nucleic acid-binding protein
MIVVADTTPLNYLVLIDEVELLPTLFTRVVLPNAAWQELQDSETPLKVRQWLLESRHPWLEVRTAGSITTPQLEPLDPGEREALQLALDLGISTVLLDEADARRIAKSLHLRVRGTLGILERGAVLGKTNFGEAIRKLDQTNFRLSKSLREEFLRRNS